MGASVAPRWMNASSRNAARNDNRIVVLHLAGGNDGLATVTPREDDLYYRNRPTIGIAKKRLLRLDDLNGFHPALRNIAKRYAEGQVCIQQGIGHSRPNLSHFLSQDIWEAAPSSERLPGTGWLGRAFELEGRNELPVPLLAAGAERMPVAMQTHDGVACVVDTLAEYQIRSRPGEKANGIDHARLRTLATLQVDAESGPLAELHSAWDAAVASTAELQRAQRFNTPKRFRGAELGRDLELVARAIGAGLETRYFYVMTGGFDTHGEQVKQHNKELAQVDVAVEDFLTELQRQGNLDKTLLLVVSEFGRRVEESGIDDTAGTDHGTANCVFAFGSRVNSGLQGGQPDLANLDETGNLIHREDFRGIYADVLENWLGLDSRAVLGGEYEPVPVVQRS